MILAEIPQIQSLSIREKLELMDITLEEKELLESRWADYLAAPESALTIEQFKSRLKNFQA